MIIYKITNLINNKIYIGLTTTSLETRWLSHKGAAKSNSRHLYCSMRKYGIENFKIEQIDEADTLEELGKLERKYIALYNSRNPDVGYNLSAGGGTSALDDNGRTKLSIEEVLHIREIYGMKELRCKECWQLYKDKISFSAFQKIWEGVTWKGIADEVYTEESKETHRHQKSNPGSLNGNSILSDNEVLEIRKYYVTHTLEETYIKYGEKYANKDSFRGIIASSYKYLPIYSKVKKKWLLNNQEINIENYNPVSTISESGE